MAADLVVAAAVPLDNVVMTKPPHRMVRQWFASLSSTTRRLLAVGLCSLLGAASYGAVRAADPRNDWLGSLVLAVPLGVIIAVLFQPSRNPRPSVELSERLTRVEQQAKALDASRARIVAAQDTERRRLERRLHDGVQQELVALVAKLRLARNHLYRGDPLVLADRTLTEIQDDACRIIDELRELAHGIHPSVLSDQGLVAAVRTCVRRVPLPVTFDTDNATTGLRFDISVEESAFFLVSEALTNVLKHAEATRVAIRIVREGDALVVEIADNGVGLPTESLDGFGITGMRDRTEAVGGDFELTSGPVGTRIFARIPARTKEVADA